MLTLKKSLTADLTNVDNLRAALQVAIELEHSTIPPYLYALYSLTRMTDPTTHNQEVVAQNAEIRELIRSIVWEEMSHMSLACNMLNAIGGHPDIDKPDFIPTYPGPLPGMVEEGLIVPLAPFSRELVKSVFMEIEQPEDPLKFPVLLAMRGAEQEPITIGQFYGQIAKAFEQGGDALFTGDPQRQLKSWGITPVTDLASALHAIQTIVEQGEGTPESPLDHGLLDESEPAHYYRFAEIYYGKKLIPNPDAPADAPYDQRYVYGGAPIVFDPQSVLPAVTNPSKVPYPAGSAAQLACQTFNYTYTGLLKALHQTFNGSPDSINAAVGMMESLKVQAINLMAMPLAEGVNAGPSFEYELVLPQQ